MHFNKIGISLVFFVLLGLTSSILLSLPTKAANADEDSAIHDDKFSKHDTSDKPEKTSDKNIECIVDFTQSYFNSPSSHSDSNICNKDSSTSSDNESDNESDNDGNIYQSKQIQFLQQAIPQAQAIPQPQDSNIGMVKIVNYNKPDSSLSNSPIVYSYINPSPYYQVQASSPTTNTAIKCPLTNNR